MSWESKTLGEISLSIQTGPFGSQLHQSDYSDDGTPVVMPKDLMNGTISEESIARVSKEHVERLEKHKIQEGDILYSRRGDVGRCAFTSEREKGWLCGTGCLKVRIDKEKAEPKFVFFQLQKAETIGWVVNHAVGSTMLNLNTSILNAVPVEVPEIEIQRKIVSILAAYDELIENNRKQIKLLKEAAQRLYKKWFVDLHFPGYEDVEIVDGMPEGWKKLPLPKIAPIVTGKKDANFATENGQYLFFTCAQEPIKAPSYSFDCDAVILAGNGDFNVKLYRGQFEAYQRTYVFSPYGSNNLYLLYYSVKNNMRQLFQGASGSTIKFLTKRMLEEIMIYIPDDNTLETFTKYCESYQKKIEILKKQITSAKEARDRLLPKLMSGEIEV